MPHTSSAKKRLRQTIKLREHNRDIMKQLKVQIKTLLKLVKDPASTAEALGTQFKATVKRLDKAAAKNVIHKNLAARKKSQLARLLNSKTAAGSNNPPAAQ